MSMWTVSEWLVTQLIAGWLKIGKNATEFRNKYIDELEKSKELMDERLIE